MDGRRTLERLQDEALERFANRFARPEDVVRLVRDAAASLGR